MKPTGLVHERAMSADTAGLDLMVGTGSGQVSGRLTDADRVSFSGKVVETWQCRATDDLFLGEELIYLRVALVMSKYRKLRLLQYPAACIIAP